MYIIYYYIGECVQRLRTGGTQRDVPPFNPLGLSPRPRCGAGQRGRTRGARASFARDIGTLRLVRVKGQACFLAKSKDLELCLDMVFQFET